MKAQEIKVLIANAEALYGGFYRCPTTGRVVECVAGDDKVICGCGKSNPRCLHERTEQTATHVVRFLDSATSAEWVAQQYPDAK
jgi:CDGSH-type Zn-finger protein